VAYRRVTNVMRKRPPKDNERQMLSCHHCGTETRHAYLGDGQYVCETCRRFRDAPRPDGRT